MRGGRCSAGDSSAIGEFGLNARLAKLFTLATLLVVMVFSSPLAAAGAEEVPEVEPGVSDSIVRLYDAVFTREPDPVGLDYWVDSYVNGTELIDIAEYFVNSPEWFIRYGDLDDVDFVRRLYLNILDRPAELAGLNYWVSELAEGRIENRAELLLYFSESPEFVEKTGTAPPVAPPSLFPALPADAGSGRRIVYSNDQQRVWLVEETGRVSDSYLVSGRANTPKPGTYEVFSKSEKAWAGHDGITMNHMIRFAWGRTLAIGFHSIPTYSSGTPLQTLDELGTYQSAGCVRQDPVKAEALYEWADVGTTVVVTE